MVQLGDIGNLALTTPALAALRSAHPSAHLAVLTTTHAAPILAGAGLADAIIAFDKRAFSGLRSLLKPATLRRILALRRDRYDAVIFCHHFTLWPGTIKFALIAFASGARRRIGLQNGRGWFLNESIPDRGFGARHEAQVALDLAALLGADGTPIAAQVAQADAKSEFLADAGDGSPWVALHAGSGGYSLARRWEPTRFAQVADTLIERHNARIVLVGGAGDDTAAVRSAMRHSPALDLSGQTTLPELVGVLARCDLFIGADSGVMHLAAAASVPVVAVFGPSNHDAWGPWNPGGRAIVVRSAPVCSPCLYVDHGIGLREGCPARTCLKMVTADDVIAAAETLLKGDRPAAPADRPTPPAERLTILGLPVDAITYDDLLDQIAAWIAAGDRAHQVCTLNPEFAIMARRDSNFLHILRRADLCVADGTGIALAAWWKRRPLPGRVTGSDGLPIIAERAAREGWRLFLLGAAPGVAEQTADELRSRFPGVQIVGTFSGSPSADEEDAIVERINVSGADLLFVAYGAPQQDAWIARNLPRLKVAMAIGVGGAFDYIAGIVPRAPGWMRRLGLEWLYRLIRQPRRIMRMTRLPRFALRVLIHERRGRGLVM